MLWPEAMAVDAAPVVPRRLLDQLADAGLYGVAGPVDAGGADLDGAGFAAVVEALGGASLATAFVWIQHHSAVRALAQARPELRRRWVAPMCRGEVRSGIAYAALRRPGPPSMVAAPSPDGLVLDGHAPWVTGWGLVDTVYVGARDGDDIVWVLLDAVASPSMRVERVALAAVDASSTVVLRLEGHVVPAERVVHREPYRDWRARDGAGLTTNGFLAVGVAARCAVLLDSPSLGQEVATVRQRLAEPGSADGAVAARADASLLAVRAATALVAAGGGRSVEVDQHAQRLMRESMFLLVFGQTGPIRAAQRARLAI